MTERGARWIGYGAFGVGAACGAWFLFVVGWPVLPLLLLGAFFVLVYTELLARTGLGEIAAGLGLGGLPVAGTALVQAGTIGPAAVAAAVPAFLMTFNLLLLNEFPDESADRGGGRRNLVLMFGRRPAARIYATAALLVPVAIVTAVVLRVLPPPCTLAVLPSLLLVRPLRWAVGTAEEPVPVPALAANVIWNLATNLVLAATLAVAPG
jgi:1,4-dihydroxy-2-naphthoate octaprenyltransferase